MRIYLSGPITGQEETAERRFRDAVNRAARPAWKAELINPYEVLREMTRQMDREAVTHAEYMTVSIALLSLCDTIYMMSGWRQSEGCKQEHQYATEHGYMIFYEDEE